MDLVPATFGQRLDQPHYIDARLERVIAGDQPHVAPADDEEPLRRSHQVAVNQRLERARAVHPRQRISAKRQRLLTRARGDEEDIGTNENVLGF